MYWNGGKGVELEPSLQKRSNMIWRAVGGVNRNITYYGVRRAKLLWSDDWENVGKKSHLSGKQHYRNGHFISNKSSTRGFIKIWFFFHFWLHTGTKRLSVANEIYINLMVCPWGRILRGCCHACLMYEFGQSWR